MKTIAVAVLAIILMVAGFLGYQKYENFKFIESLTPHVKNASLRVANSARYESEEGSKITYKEFFEKIESDIQEIDKRLIEIQSISSPKNSSTTDPTVAYLKASQEYLRALLQKYRRMLKLSNAMDWSRKQLDELRSATSYAFDYAKKSSTKAIEELGEAEREYNESVPELAKTVAALKEARSKIVGVFSEDALIPIAQLDKVAEKNTPSKK